MQQRKHRLCSQPIRVAAGGHGQGCVALALGLNQGVDQVDGKVGRVAGHTEQPRRGALAQTRLPPRQGAFERLGVFIGPHWPAPLGIGVGVSVGVDGHAGQGLVGVRLQALQRHQGQGCLVDANEPFVLPTPSAATPAGQHHGRDGARTQVPNAHVSRRCSSFPPGALSRWHRVAGWREGPSSDRRGFARSRQWHWRPVRR